MARGRTPRPPVRVAAFRPGAGFTLPTVLTLGLGIGVARAINAVVFRPLDYGRPDQLVQLYETGKREGGEADCSTIAIDPARYPSPSSATSRPGPTGRARLLLAGGSRSSGRIGGPVWRQIVGVVQGTRHVGLEAAQKAEIYVPVTQSPVPFLTLVVRTKGDPASLIPAVRSLVGAIDPEQSVFWFQTMDELVAKSSARRRFQTALSLSARPQGREPGPACRAQRGVMQEFRIEN